jgi:hypothetical protein
LIEQQRKLYGAGIQRLAGTRPARDAIAVKSVCARLLGLDPQVRQVVSPDVPQRYRQLAEAMVILQPG